jgi:hypothetical protein
MTPLVYSSSESIYIAPSGVQKERIQPEDMFIVSPDGKILQSPPPEKNLKESQCTPLFFNAYNMGNVQTPSKSYNLSKRWSSHSHSLPERCHGYSSLW